MKQNLCRTATGKLHEEMLSSLVQPLRSILQPFRLSIESQNQIRVDEEIDKPRDDATKHFLWFVLCLSAWINAEGLPPLGPEEESGEGGNVPRNAVVLAVQSGDPDKCGAFAEQAWFAHGRWEVDRWYWGVTALRGCLFG